MRANLFFFIGLVVWALFVGPRGPVAAEEGKRDVSISLDLQDANLKDVLKIFSQQSGMNFIASEDVQDRRITLYLDGVTVQDALNNIMSSNKLTYEQAPGSNIFVVKAIQKEETPKTEMRLYSLKYMRVEAEEDDSKNTGQTTTGEASSEGKAWGEIKTIIERLLSKDGQIMADGRTNSLIVIDVAEKFGQIEEAIAKLDKPVLQVVIETQMIETGLGSDEKLGIDWSLQVKATGAVRPTTFPFQSGGRSDSSFLTRGDTSAVQTTSQTQGGGQISSSATYFPALQAFPFASKEEFVFGKLNFSQFQAVLDVLKSRSDTKVVSNPRITTLSDKEAHILVGEVLAIPVFERNESTGSMEITGYQDKEVGVKLYVTPHINPNNEIVVKLKPEVSSLSGYDKLTADITVPRFATREASTEVMVKDGETIVIGGLVSERTSDFVKKVPILGDIPLLGFAFTRKEKGTSKSDLLIFVTPRIIGAHADLQAQAQSRPQEKPFLPSTKEDAMRMILEESRKKPK